MKLSDLVSVVALVILTSLVGVSNFSFSASLIQPNSVLKIDSAKEPAKSLVQKDLLLN